MSVREVLVGSDHWPTGGFYPSDPAVLRAALDDMSPARDDADRIRAIGVIAPHAGWQYSGPVMGEVFSRVVVPECAVILCPNHTGQVPRSPCGPRPGAGARRRARSPSTRTSTD